MRQKKPQFKYVLWRKNPVHAHIYTFKGAIKQAKEEVGTGAKWQEIIAVLEIKKVVTRQKVPVIVKDYKVTP